MHSRHSSVLRGALCALLAFAVPASAQLAQASDKQLVAFNFDAVGGGSGAGDIAAHASLEGANSEPMSSGQYTAHVGFLIGNNPGAASGPVLYGLQPEFGPKAGGTPLTISGLNFSELGPSFAVSVTLDGHPATGVVVHSDSIITADSPAGVSGPCEVVVTGNFSSASKADAYVYTPAITTTPLVPIGDPIQIRNYGPIDDHYWCFVSLNGWAAQTKFGTLLIGPTIFQLIPPTAYPQPDGVASLTVIIPNDPVLSGLDIHFQSLSLTQLQPAHGAFTNASVTTIP